jgi:Uma2 family endonuclease
MSTEETLHRHRLTVDEYYRMAEVGILAPDARVELIEGEIVDVAPIGSRHSSTVNRLNRILTRAAGDRSLVQVQGPVRLGIRSEPVPDLAVLRHRDDFYRNSHATGADVLLVIEVSNSTLAYDRDVKIPLYARHGIQEAWLVDLKANRLVCFSRPIGGEYQQVATLVEPGITVLRELPEISVDLSGIF